MDEAEREAAGRSDTERGAWNSVAEAWERWWPVFEDGAQDLSDDLVSRAGVVAGDRVLDVATGVGEPALTAAARVGPGGSVTGIDVAGAMLAVARRRAAAAGRKNLRFVELDATDLPIPGRSFDAAVSRWGLMLVPDPAAAARGVYASLEPAGRFAAAVWAEADQVPFLALPRRIFADELGAPAPEPDAPGPFRLSRTDDLVSVLTSAGFTRVEVAVRRVKLSFATPGHYARFICEVSSLARRLLGASPAGARDRSVAALERAAAAYGSDTGVTFENRALVVVGLRPGTAA